MMDSLRRRLVPAGIARRGGVSGGAAVEKGNPGASIVQSIFNLTKNIVGIGLLSLPAAVAAGTGVRLAICLVVALGVYSAYTFSVYGRLCAASGERTFRGLGLKASGARLARAMDWAATLRTMFACWAFSIVVADSFSTMLQSSGAPAVVCSRNTVLLSMSVFVLLPLCLLPNLSALSYTSFLGSIGMLYTVTFMAIRCLDGSYTAGGPFFSEEFVGSYARGSWCADISTLVLVSTLGTACSCHYNAPKYYDQLRDRSVGRFNTVVAVSFGLAVVMCLMAMCAGFLTFGDASRGNILLNYHTRDPRATAARVAVSSSVVCTFPLAFTGLRDGVMSLLRVPQTARNFYVTTLLLMSLTTGLAFAVKNVAFVVNLGGAVFGALTVYIFPGILFLLLTQKGAGPERQFAKATVTSGVLLGVLGSVVAVVQEFAPTRLR